MSDTFWRQLQEITGEARCFRQEPMGRHTTFRVGGPAEYYACPKRSQIAPLIALCQSQGMPWMVIGNGSNLLVGDKGIKGVVIELGKDASEVKVEGNSLTAEAGALLSAAARNAAEHGLAGMEFASGIPGTVGGAVAMNAGAYGGEMKHIVNKVTVLTMEGREEELSLQDMDFGYRHSCVFENHSIVLEAEFALEQGNIEDIRGRMAELRSRRSEKQPLEYPSAGSTFKRPEGYFAGKLIQDAGLRGYRVGDAQVSEKHCGFVINRGGATAAEIRRLISDVQEKVEAQSGVSLEPEVRFLGEF
ncbi:MAG: UDP-N-acetylmuramate dehydrogenase [Lachnospiraceae bacterium]|nr:UDP-N-acetylmuramate dehydrogenase [Lachnospiraceae bacterium]